MKIAVFGLGYVGTVSAACLAMDGHDVIGVDPNATKVDLINGGQPPIIEKDVGEMIREAVAGGRLNAVTGAEAAVRASDLSLVCVGTPSAENGSLNLRFVELVCREIGAALKDHDSYHTVVIRSTILPGTMNSLVIPALENTSGKKAGKDFGLCNNPEFLRESTAVFDYYHPPKTVIGAMDAESSARLSDLYKDLPGPKIVTTIEVAETVKYVDNVWHAVKVSFANEIGAICKQINVDSHEVMDIFCQDQKLNLSPYYLKPGFAFGGSCLPKDVRALTFHSKRLDLNLPLLESIMETNRIQIERAFDLIVGRGKRKIGILGFSFKAGTDDLRESPIVEVAERLIGKGYDLRLYDRNVSLARLVGANKDYILHHIPHLAALMVESPDELMAHSELLIIGNGDEEFAEIVAKRTPDQHVIDFVRIGNEANDADGYEGIAW
ncbi:MAG: nucleotide sugar dehydrogenase [Gammaproteobacteria bacterium]